VIHRRSFLKSFASVGALAAAGLTFPAPGVEAASTTWGGGFTGYVYNGGDSDVEYAYLYSGPTLNSTWIADVPTGTSVTVFGYSYGDILDPANSVWYRVLSPQGTGFIYSGLITNFAPVTVSAWDVALPPGPVPGPAGNGVGRSISLSVSRQHIYAYDGSTMIFDSDITTGHPDLPTPTGFYRVQAKMPNFTFHSPWPVGSPYWYPDSPTSFALLFRQGGYFIHNAPWRPYYGPGTNMAHLDPDGVVRQGSHGCVNVPYDGAAFLYGWAGVGTPVAIIT